MSFASTCLVIVCILAALAAMGVVSPWAPLTGPVLSMLIAVVVLLTGYVIYEQTQDQKNK